MSENNPPVDCNKDLELSYDSVNNAGGIIITKLNKHVLLRKPKLNNDPFDKKIIDLTKIDINNLHIYVLQNNIIKKNFKTVKDAYEHTKKNTATYYLVIFTFPFTEQTNSTTRQSHLQFGGKSIKRKKRKKTIHTFKKKDIHFK